MNDQTGLNMIFNDFNLCGRFNKFFVFNYFDQVTTLNVPRMILHQTVTVSNSETLVIVVSATNILAMKIDGDCCTRRTKHFYFIFIIHFGNFPLHAIELHGIKKCG